MTLPVFEHKSNQAPELPSIIDPLFLTQMELIAVKMIRLQNQGQGLLSKGQDLLVKEEMVTVVGANRDEGSQRAQLGVMKGERRRLADWSSCPSANDAAQLILPQSLKVYMLFTPSSSSCSPHSQKKSKPTSTTISKKPPFQPKKPMIFPTSTTPSKNPNNKSSKPSSINKSFQPSTQNNKGLFTSTTTKQTEVNNNSKGLFYLKEPDSQPHTSIVEVDGERRMILQVVRRGEEGKGMVGIKEEGMGIGVGIGVAVGGGVRWVRGIRGQLEQFSQFSQFELFNQSSSQFNQLSSQLNQSSSQFSLVPAHHQNAQSHPQNVQSHPAVHNGYEGWNEQQVGGSIIRDECENSMNQGNSVNCNQQSQQPLYNQPQSFQNNQPQYHQPHYHHQQPYPSQQAPIPPSCSPSSPILPLPTTFKRSNPGQVLSQTRPLFDTLLPNGTKAQRDAIQLEAITQMKIDRRKKENRRLLLGDQWVGEEEGEIDRMKEKREGNNKEEEGRGRGRNDGYDQGQERDNKGYGYTTTSSSCQYIPTTTTTTTTTNNTPLNQPSNSLIPSNPTTHTSNLLSTLTTNIHHQHPNHHHQPQPLYQHPTSLPSNPTTTSHPPSSSIDQNLISHAHHHQPPKGLILENKQLDTLISKYHVMGGMIGGTGGNGDGSRGNNADGGGNGSQGNATINSNDNNNNKEDNSLFNRENPSTNPYHNSSNHYHHQLNCQNNLSNHKTINIYHNTINNNHKTINNTPPSHFHINNFQYQLNTNSPTNNNQQLSQSSSVITHKGQVTYGTLFQALYQQQSLRLQSINNPNHYPPHHLSASSTSLHPSTFHPQPSKHPSHSLTPQQLTHLTTQFQHLLLTSSTQQQSVDEFGQFLERELFGRRSGDNEDRNNGECGEGGRVRNEETDDRGDGRDRGDRINSRRECYLDSSSYPNQNQTHSLLIRDQQSSSPTSPLKLNSQLPLSTFIQVISRAHQMMIELTINQANILVGDHRQSQQQQSQQFPFNLNFNFNINFTNPIALSSINHFHPFYSSNPTTLPPSLTSQITTITSDHLTRLMTHLHQLTQTQLLQLQHVVQSHLTQTNQANITSSSSINKQQLSRYQLSLYEYVEQVVVRGMGGGRGWESGYGMDAVEDCIKQLVWLGQVDCGLGSIRSQGGGNNKGRNRTVWERDDGRDDNRDGQGDDNTHTNKKVENNTTQTNTINTHKPPTTNTPPTNNPNPHSPNTPTITTTNPTSLLSQYLTTLQHTLLHLQQQLHLITYDLNQTHYRPTSTFYDPHSHQRINVYPHSQAMGGWREMSGMMSEDRGNGWGIEGNSQEDVEGIGEGSWVKGLVEVMGFQEGVSELIRNNNNNNKTEDFLSKNNKQQQQEQQQEQQYQQPQQQYSTIQQPRRSNHQTVQPHHHLFSHPTPPSFTLPQPSTMQDETTQHQLTLFNAYTQNIAQLLAQVESRVDLMKGSWLFGVQ